MARVTVEDCIEKVDNRFELVLLAAHRARLISSGSPLTVDRDRDKNPVVALREIADERIDKDDLREDYIHSMQKQVEVDEPETNAVPLMIGSAEMEAVAAMQEAKRLPGTAVHHARPGGQRSAAPCLDRRSRSGPSSRRGSGRHTQPSRQQKVIHRPRLSIGFHGLSIDLCQRSR